MVFEIFVAGGQDSKDWSWCAATVGKQHSWTNSTHQRSSFPGFFSHLETISLQTGMTAHQSFWSLVSIAGQAFAAAERERLRERSTIFNSDGMKIQKWIENCGCETLREHPDLAWFTTGLHFFWRTWFHYRLVGESKIGEMWWNALRCQRRTPYACTPNLSPNQQATHPRRVGCLMRVRRCLLEARTTPFPKSLLQVFHLEGVQFFDIQPW